MDRVGVDGLYGRVWLRAFSGIGWHDAFGVMMARPRSFIYEESPKVS